MTIQEDIDAFTDGEGHRHHPVDAGLAVQDADEVGQVVQDGKIVLHYNDVSNGGGGGVSVWLIKI